MAKNIVRTRRKALARKMSLRTGRPVGWRNGILRFNDARGGVASVKILSKSML
jgi:hypothetical protein